jgi:multidrug efflux system outer membrane protein
MNKTIVLALCIAVALAGCAMGPDYRRPELNVPDSFRAQQETPSEESLADISWWELYQEKVLQELIRVALEQNRDVGIAAARVAEARALVGASRLAQWPQISAGAGAARSRTPLAARTPGIDERRTVYEASLDMSFEIDLWGRLSSLTDAARADLLSTEFARESVRVSLIGDVATAYFDLLSLDQQLRITHQTVATRESFLELTQSRFRQGVSSGLEVDRAEASLALARASLPELERQIGQTENQLKVLLGQYPGPIVRERMQLETMPIPPSVPAGAVGTAAGSAPGGIQPGRCKRAPQVHQGGAFPEHCAYRKPGFAEPGAQ